MLSPAPYLRKKPNSYYMKFICLPSNPTSLIEIIWLEFFFNVNIGKIIMSLF